VSELTEMVDTFFNGRPARSPKEVEELKEALVESVKLQSHYAQLLNMYDGGQRIVFKNAREWLERLSEMKKKGIPITPIRPEKKKWWGKR